VKESFVSALQGQKYISLASFRKTGVAVRTPLWFVEDDGALYIFTNPKSGKCKRMKNNPRVTIAPCTMRGRVTGQEFSGAANFLPPEEFPRVRKMLEGKYWLMKLPFLWSKDSVFLRLDLD